MLATFCRISTCLAYHQRYLIVGRLQVVRRGLHYLHRSVVAVFEVLRQPHRREVPPAQLLDEDVAVDQHFAHVAGVVAEWGMSYPPIL